MPILNYTTTISVSKTAGEIQEILAKAGANRVMIEFGSDRTPDAIYFEIDVNNRTAQFRLPSRWHGVAQSLQDSKVERKFKTEEQARRVAWRIIKDWCEAQLAIIEAGAAELAEVFFPYLINPASNETIYHDFIRYQLPPGDFNAQETLSQD
jgi:hypothetical protein